VNVSDINARAVVNHGTAHARPKRSNPGSMSRALAFDFVERGEKFLAAVITVSDCVCLCSRILLTNAKYPTGHLADGIRIDVLTCRFHRGRCLNCLGVFVQAGSCAVVMRVDFSVSIRAIKS
jgi:hypothetical protein